MAKKKKRDTYRYKMKDGNQTVYFGITDNFTRRKQEHKTDGKKFSKIETIGPKVTRDSALKWEKESIEKYKRKHKGKKPKYND